MGGSGIQPQGSPKMDELSIVDLQNPPMHGAAPKSPYPMDASVFPSVQWALCMVSPQALMVHQLWAEGGAEQLFVLPCCSQSDGGGGSLLVVD